MQWAKWQTGHMCRLYRTIRHAAAWVHRHVPTLDPVDERRAALGRAIRRARVWREMTQPQLAARMGTTSRTVGRWESGAAVPSLLELGPLCAALGVSSEYLRRAPDEDVDRLLLE